MLVLEKLHWKQVLKKVKMLLLEMMPELLLFDNKLRISKPKSKHLEIKLTDLEQNIMIWKSKSKDLELTLQLPKTKLTNTEIKSEIFKTELMLKERKPVLLIWMILTRWLQLLKDLSPPSNLKLIDTIIIATVKALLKLNRLAVLLSTLLEDKDSEII